MDLRLFSLLSLLLLIVTVIFTLYRHSMYDKAKTISVHMVTTTSSYVLFALTLTFASAAFYLFFNAWLMPELQLPAIFYFLSFILFISQFIIAWLPDGVHIYGAIHRVASFGASIIMLATIALLIVFGDGLLVMFLCSATALLMFFYIFLYIRVKQAHRYMLYFQGSYFLAFYATVLSVAYLY